MGLYRVAGESMLPAYKPGDVLLGWRWSRRPAEGRVIVARHAGRPLVKRLIRHEIAGAWLEGDNAAHSTDSRSFGAVPRSAIEAVIVRRLF